MHTNCLHARWPYLSGWLLAKHNSSALLCILQPSCSQEEKKRGFIIIIIKVLNDRNSVTKSLNVLLPPFQPTLPTDVLYLGVYLHTCPGSSL